MGMRKDEQKQHQGGAITGSGRPNGLIPISFRAISSYLRIVSSGASTVARSAASVASSIVDRDGDADRDQVCDVLEHLGLLVYYFPHLIIIIKLFYES